MRIGLGGASAPLPLQKHLPAFDALGDERDGVSPVIDFPQDGVQRVEAEPAEPAHPVPEPARQRRALSLVPRGAPAEVAALEGFPVQTHAAPFIGRAKHLFARERKHLPQHPHDARAGVPQTEPLDFCPGEFAVGLGRMREQHEIVHKVPEPDPLTLIVIIQMLQLHNQGETDTRGIKSFGRKRRIFKFGQKDFLERTSTAFGAFPCCAGSGSRGIKLRPHAVIFPPRVPSAGNRRPSRPFGLRSPLKGTIATKATSCQVAGGLTQMQNQLQPNLLAAEAFGHEHQGIPPVTAFPQDGVDRVEAHPLEGMHPVAEPAPEHKAPVDPVGVVAPEVPAGHGQPVQARTTPCVGRANHEPLRESEHLLEHVHDCGAGVSQVEPLDLLPRKGPVVFGRMHQQYKVVHVLLEPDAAKTVAIYVRELHNQRKADARRIETFRREGRVFQLGIEQCLEFLFSVEDVGSAEMDLYVYAVLALETDVLANLFDSLGTRNKPHVHQQAGQPLPPAGDPYVDIAALPRERIRVQPCVGRTLQNSTAQAMFCEKTCIMGRFLVNQAVHSAHGLRGTRPVQGNPARRTRTLGQEGYRVVGDPQHALLLGHLEQGLPLVFAGGIRKIVRYPEGNLQ